MSMTIDERLESVARNLDMLTRIHLDSDREYRERFEEFAKVQARFDESMERLSIAQERNSRDIQALSVLLSQDAENIRALARIAERHQERLDRLDPQ